MYILASIVELLLPLVVLACGYGFYRTWKTGTSSLYAEFLSGLVPKEMPEGLYEGIAEELPRVSWKGKKFLSGVRGINLFIRAGQQTEAYPFTLSAQQSICFSGRTVLRLDYGQKENPWWLRFIVDEMLLLPNGEFLGIVLITILPGMPFRMGYFRLRKPA